MSDKTSHDRADGTVLDHSNPTAPWWPEVAERLLPEIARRLAQRFGDWHGASPEQAVSSAVRELLQPDEQDLRFENVEDLRRWLYTVAWRKAKDALAKEHLDRRAPPVEPPVYEDAAAAGCAEADKALAEVREALDPWSQTVLDAMLAGQTSQAIAQANSRTLTEVETARKRVWRRIRAQAGSLQP